MTTQTKPQHVNTISAGFTLISAFLYMYAIGLVEDGTSHYFVHMEFWQYRFPFLILFPKLILDTGAFFNWKLNRHLSMYWNGFLMLASIMVLTIIVCPPSPTYQNETTGTIYFFILAVQFYFLVKMLWLNFDKSTSLLYRSVFFIIMVWFYGSYASWTTQVRVPTGDEPHYLLMAHSMYHDQNLNLWDEYQNEEYSDFHPDHLQPKPSDINKRGIIKSVGLGPTFPALILPAYAIGGYISVVILIVLITALLIVQTFSLYSDIFPGLRATLLSSIMIGVIPPVIFYCDLVYPDMISALIIVVCARILIRTYPRRKEPYFILTVLLCCFVLLLLKFRFFPIVLILLIASISKIHHGAIKTFKIGAAALLLIVSYFSIDAFMLKGDLFAQRFGSMNLMKFYLPDLDSLSVLPGFFIDNEAGISWISPLLLLVIPGIRTFQPKKSILWFICTMAVPVTILTLLGHSAWHSMPTPPLRYLLPVIPITGIFGCLTIQKIKKFNPLVRLCAINFFFFSVLMSFVLSIRPDWQMNVADGTSEIFSNLGLAVNLPLSQFLPSLLRPELNLFFWIPAFSLLIIYLLKSPDRNRNSYLMLRHASVPVVLMLVIALYLDQHQIHKIHCEDIDLSRPSSGYFFPRKKDPFFHREKHLGWELPPGEILELKLNSHPGTWFGLLKAKLLDDPHPVRLIIQNGFESFILTVRNTQWNTYLTYLAQDTTHPVWTIQSDPYNTSSVALDSYQIYQPDPEMERLWFNLAGLTRIPAFSLSELLCLSEGLKNSSPNVIQALSSYTNPRQLIQKRSPETIDLKYQSQIFPRYIELLLESGYDKLFRHQLLFGFTSDLLIVKDQMPEYLIEAVKVGISVQTQMINRIIRTNPENSDLIMAAAVQSYLNNDIRKTLNHFEKVIAAKKCPTMSMKYPDKAGKCFPDFKAVLQNISVDPVFISFEQHYIESIWRDVIDAYAKENLDLSIELARKVYELDVESFRMYLMECDELFLQRVVYRIPGITADIASQIAESFIDKNQFKKALICAELGLQKNGNSLPVRLMIARSLFHNLRFDDAWQQCLMAINIKFDDDHSRSLLNLIRKTSHLNSRKIGLEPSEPDK